MPTRLPPGPGHWIGLGFIRRFQRDPLKLLIDLHQQYGDVAFARMGPLRAFFLYHPDHIREALVTHAKSLPKFKWQMDVLRQWDGNGLLLSEGDFWLRQRRLVQPAFHPKRMAGYAQTMVERASRFAERWAGQPAAQTVDVEKSMTDLTLEIVAKTLFDVELADEARELGNAVAVLSDVAVREMGQVVRRPNWLPLPSIRRKLWAMKYLDATIRRFIAERRLSGQDKGDLLSMLLLATDEEGDRGIMTDEQARDEAMVLFLAGHDTTAAGLTWTFYALAKHAQVEAQTVAEIDQVLAGRLPTIADVPKLAYTQQVIKETLRLYPPAVGVFARQASTNLELAGYPVSKGDLVYMFSYVTQRDARWFPDPERFDPARFTPENEKRLPPFAYFPFGGGPRVCIGSAFAMTEMTLVVATILQRCRLTLAQPDPELSVLMSLRPKGGLQMKIQSR